MPETFFLKKLSLLDILIHIYSDIYMYIFSAVHTFIEESIRSRFTELLYYVYFICQLLYNSSTLHEKLY